MQGSHRRTAALRTPRRVALALSLAVLVSAGACGAPSAPGPAAAPAPAPSAPAPTPPPAPPPADHEAFPRPDPAPDPTAPEDCGALDRAAIVRVVSAQLTAFAADDLTAAYALTSATFQQALSVTAFSDLIRTEYPELLGNRGHRVDVCGIHADVAHLVVGVLAAPEATGPAEVVLRYDLTLLEGAWLIDGASRLTGVTVPQTPVV